MIEIHVHDNVILYDEDTIEENELLKTYIEMDDNPESCKNIILPYDGVINDAILKYSRLNIDMLQNIDIHELEDWIKFKSFLLYEKAENRFPDDVMYLYTLIHSDKCTTFDVNTLQVIFNHCIENEFVESIKYISTVEQIYNHSIDSPFVHIYTKQMLCNISTIYNNNQCKNIFEKHIQQLERFYRIDPLTLEYCFKLDNTLFGRSIIKIIELAINHNSVYVLDRMDLTNLDNMIAYNIIASSTEPKRYKQVYDYLFERDKCPFIKMTFYSGGLIQIIAYGAFDPT